MPPMRCVIVGSGTLATACGELLRGSGHTIAAVVAPPGDQLWRWAEQAAITCIEPAAVGAALAAATPFDYLFSIASPLILPTALLALPGQAAINYHDAPLPRYAGTHATSWALINREPEHGVSWHLMVAQVDAGPIVAQERFAIAPGETALSLNARCYEAAQRSFASLAEHLNDGTLVPAPQDLRERSFYRISQRPPATGMLRWSHQAGALDALVRALTFGTYPNALGMPKLLADGQVLLIDTAEAAVATSTAPPGTILALDDQQLVVAAGAGQLHVRRFVGLDGRPLSVGAALGRLGLRPGDCLPDLAPEQAALLTQHHEALCQHEAFWVERLAQLAPLDPPYALTLGTRPQQLETTIPAGPRAFLQALDSADEPGQALLAACCIFLARLAGQARADMGLRDQASVAACRRLARDLRRGAAAADRAGPRRALRHRPGAQLRGAHRPGRPRDPPRRYCGPLPRAARCPPRLPVVLDLGRSRQRLKPTCVNAIAADLEAASAGAAALGDLAHWRAGREPAGLLEALAAAPARPVGVATLLAPAEHQLLLTDWARAARPFPQADLASLLGRRLAHCQLRTSAALQRRGAELRQLNAQAGSARPRAARGAGLADRRVCLGRSTNPGRHTAGRAQGRRGLSAARPGLPGRAAGLYAARLGALPGAERGPQPARFATTACRCCGSMPKWPTIARQPRRISNARTTPRGSPM
ncbi:MAG: formyltransferase family protein [Kouleothrix sp.]